MTKFDKCPQCGSSNLGDRWCEGRKLQQFCREILGDYDECTWNGKPRIPEQKEITAEEMYTPIGCGGIRYTMYDKYGHTMILL